EVLFVSGQAVADDQRGMEPGSGGLVRYAVDEEAVTGNVQDRHFRGMGSVGGRVGEDDRRHRLGWGGRRDADGCQNDEREQAYESARGRYIHWMILLWVGWALSRRDTM